MAIFPNRRLLALSALVLLLVSSVATAEDEEPCPTEEENAIGEFVAQGEAITKAVEEDPLPVFASINEAVAERVKKGPPEKQIAAHGNVQFPSFSSCPKTYFRVVTITKDVDKILMKDGWKSGWERGESGNALPPSSPLSERVIQYVGVKGEKLPFPRNSTIVGIMEDPVRTLSVGWHTGYNQGHESGNYMRMDEIELGACAKAPECQNIKPVDSSEIFKSDAEARAQAGKKIRTPRYSTEGEWAVEQSIPASCVVSSYRILYQKVDNVHYSGSY